MITELDHILTEKDFEIAEANGIPRKIVRARFNRLFWDKKDCITKPVRSYRDDEWRMKCKELGIVDITTFDQRIKRGWDGERAATVPKMTKDEIAQRNREIHQRYPSWVYDRLKQNNIKKQTFLNRMKGNRWNLKEACTVPEGMTLVDYYRNRVDELESKSG
jgi:hypothetical protein